MAFAIGLLMAMAGTSELKAQFTSTSYMINNNLSCDIVVFMEFTRCPTGGTYYTSASYAIPAFSSLTIPVVINEDAWVVVTVPSSIPNPLPAVAAAGSPCVGAPPATNGTNACGIAGAEININTTPSGLNID